MLLMRARPWIAVLFALLCSTAYGEKKIASACGHHDYPPWNWEEDGYIVGACAEATKELFARAGLTLDLSYIGPWKRCQRDIQLGHVDINICSFINPKREKYSQFIKTPMGFNEIAIFNTRDRQIRFEQWQDLEHRIVGIVRGVSMGTEFDQFLKDHTLLTKTNHYRSLFKMLSLHRLDAVPFGRHSGKTYLRSMGMESEIVDHPTPVLVGKLYFSMSKRSPYLNVLPIVESELKKPGYDQYMNQLLDKYTHYYAETHKDE